MIHHKHKISKYSRAALLLSVYAMHLLVFQALMMVLTYHSDSDENVKPLFAVSHKTHKQQNASHPAVTYYTMLVKQGNSGLRSCCDASVIHAQITGTIELSDISETPGYVAATHTLWRLGDGFFKIYRFIRVFLI